MFEKPKKENDDKDANEKNGKENDKADHDQQQHEDHHRHHQQRRRREGMPQSAQRAGLHIRPGEGPVTGFDSGGFRT